MKIEDKSYFASKKPIPKYKVDDIVKTQTGKYWGKIIKVEVNKGHYDRFYVTYVVDLKSHNDEVAYGEDELTKVDTKTGTDYCPYRPTGRQGIYSKDFPVEDKRYFALQDKGADDRSLKNSVALEIQQEIKSLENVLARKQSELKSKGWDINWEGLPAAAEREKKKWRYLHNLLANLMFLKGLLSQGSDPADIKKDLIKAVKEIKKAQQ